MKDFDQFHGHYLFDVPQCTHVIAGRAILEAAREFCERTKAWRARLDAQTTIANLDTYEVDPLAQSEVVQLIRATLDGQAIAQLLEDAIGTTERGIVMLSPSEYLLQPMPDRGSVVQLRAVLKPSSNATGIDDTLFSLYGRQIAIGAKAILFAQANQPYSNLEAAGVERAQFERAIMQAKNLVAKAHSGAPSRVQAQFM